MTQAPVSTFHAPGHVGSSTVLLDESQAHHAHVKRLAVGDVVRLSDGAGALANGRIVRLTKKACEVDVDAATRVEVARPPAVALLVPVADRDRMLWLAEKCAELALTSWIPVTRS